MTASLLMVTDDFVAGGAFRVGVKLAYGLARDYRVAFACAYSQLNFAARRRLVDTGVELFRLFAHADETRRARYDRGGACRLFQRARPDQILFVDSSPRSNLAAKDVAHEAGIPYVCIINFVDKVTPDALKVFDSDVERTVNAATAVVFVSSAARAEFEANYPGVRTPRLVINNGVPEEFFQPGEPETRRNVRHELNVGDDEVMLLLLGRLEPRKGQEVALATLAALRARGAEPPVRLVLAGFGDARAKAALDAEVRLLRLEDRVSYLGLRDDVPRLLDACDIVLMPSEQEADPLVSKEAMAKGRPVIASDLPGVREQGHPEAFLVPPPGESPEKTVAALVEALDDLRRDVRKRETAGRSLRAIAERKFTLTQMADAYLRILKAAPTIGSVRLRATAAPPLGSWSCVSEPRWTASLFKDGWSEFEAEGIWSLNSRSRIAFAVPQPMSHIDIDCQVWTFATPGRTRKFDVFANGRKIATWTFSNSKRTTKTIRIASAHPKRTFVVQFRNPDRASPFDLGLNGDRRNLGFNVSSVRIREAKGRGRLWAKWAKGALRRAKGWKGWGVP